MVGSPIPVIRLENVTKIFATEEVETHALSSVSFTVERGDQPACDVHYGQLGCIGVHSV